MVQPFKDHCSIFGTWHLQNYARFLYNVYLSFDFYDCALKCKYAAQNVFKIVLFFSPGCLKMPFFHIWVTSIRWPSKRVFMLNITFIEVEAIGNDLWCKDEFYKSVVRPAKKLFEVKIFVPFSKQSSKPVSKSLRLHCNIIHC